MCALEGNAPFLKTPFLKCLFENPFLKCLLQTALVQTALSRVARGRGLFQRRLCISPWPAARAVAARPSLRGPPFSLRHRLGARGRGRRILDDSIRLTRQAAPSRHFPERCAGAVRIAVLPRRGQDGPLVRADSSRAKTSWETSADAEDTGPVFEYFFGFEALYGHS